MSVSDDNVIEAGPRFWGYVMDVAMEPMPHKKCDNYNDYTYANRQTNLPQYICNDNLR